MARLHRRTSQSVFFTVVVITLSIALSGASTYSAFAQDSTPASELPPTAVVTPEPELPPVDPEPEPELPPADPEPDPELLPGEEELNVTPETPEQDPEPTVTSVSPDPVDEVVEGGSESTPDSIVEPTATAAPVPIITWSQSAPVQCELRDGADAGLKFAESRTYHCNVAANASSDSAMPGDMQIRWIVDVSFPDSYQLTFPAGSLAEMVTAVNLAESSTRYTVSHPWRFDSAQQLAFEVIVSRTTCAIDPLILTVQAIPEIGTATSEVQVSRAEGNATLQPESLVSPVIAASGPNIEFLGPITFTPITATTTGLSSTMVKGTAVFVVSGEWDPCTDWSVTLVGAAYAPADTPAVLSVTSINDEKIPGESCDLGLGCTILLLPNQGQADSPHTYTIGLELHLHEETIVGEIAVDLTVSTHGQILP